MHMHPRKAARSRLGNGVPRGAERASDLRNDKSCNSLTCGVALPQCLNCTKTACVNAYSVHVMTWSEYVKREMGGRRQADVAVMVGVNQTTISRWANGVGNQPDAGNAIAFARAVGANPVEALLVLGILEPNDLERAVNVVASASALSNVELVRALADRLGVPVTERGRARDE